MIPANFLTLSIWIEWILRKNQIYSIGFRFVVHLGTVPCGLNAVADSVDEIGLEMGRPDAASM